MNYHDRRDASKIKALLIKAFAQILESEFAGSNMVSPGTKSDFNKRISDYGNASSAEGNSFTAIKLPVSEVDANLFKWFQLIHERESSKKMRNSQFFPFSDRNR